jgi:hypothetical protein
MNKLKASKIIMFVLLWSVFITSCIPIGGNDNPTPTGTAFSVMLAHNTSSILPNDTTLIMDGDTIRFTIFEVDFFTISTFVVFSTNNNNFEILTANRYWYNYRTNTYDSTSINPPFNEIDAFKGGLLIDNNYNANTWRAFVKNDSVYVAGVFCFQNTQKSPDLYNGLHHNTDEYIVLRKPKDASYQYYWIRVRTEGIYTDPHAFTVKVLNGKYKLNSITTGQ